MTYRSDWLIDAAERKRVASPQVPVAEWTGRVGVETTSRRRYVGTAERPASRTPEASHG